MKTSGQVSAFSWEPYAHFCRYCIWVGWVECSRAVNGCGNMYFCPPEMRHIVYSDEINKGLIIVRYGDDDHDYLSTPVSSLTKGGGYRPIIRSQDKEKHMRVKWEWWPIPCANGVQGDPLSQEEVVYNDEMCESLKDRLITALGNRLISIHVTECTFRQGRGTGIRIHEILGEQP